MENIHSRYEQQGGFSFGVTGATGPEEKLYDNSDAVEDALIPDQFSTVSVYTWTKVFVISAIPGINIIMWIKWALCKTVPPSQSNFGKAMLWCSCAGIFCILVFSLAIITGINLGFSHTPSKTIVAQERGNYVPRK